MKTPEQQLVDLFHKFSVQRFDHTEFARLLSQQDLETQKTFFYCLTSFVAYKAGFAKNYAGEISPNSLASWCVQMDLFMDEYQQEINFGVAEIPESL